MICMETPPASSMSLLSTRILRVRRSLELNAREKLIARVLLDYIGNRPDGCCWPSLARIAQEAAVSVRTVQRAVQGLRTRGFISMAPRHRENGGQTSSLYQWLDRLSPGGGDTVANEHKRHLKELDKEHVAACDLKKARGGAAPPQPREPEQQESQIEPSKRYAQFEPDPEKFLSFDACNDACEKAVTAGFIADSEADTILFWTLYAAICRKLKGGKVSNPARLLRFLLDSRKAAVTYCRQSDEDSARRALKAYRRQA